MIERRSCRCSLILEDQSMNEPRIFLQIDETIPVDPEHFTDVIDAQPRHANFEVRALDDHLVRPDAIHQVIDAVPSLVESPFDLQGGELVRYDADPPAW